MSGGYCIAINPSGSRFSPLRYQTGEGGPTFRSHVQSQAVLHVTTLGHRLGSGRGYPRRGTHGSDPSWGVPSRR